MLTLKQSTKFKKDYRRMKKQGKDMNLLKDVIKTLLAEKPLDSRYLDHALVGNYAGFRECHIEPDWLLIYFINGDTLTLTASRTDSHSDVF